MSDRLTESLKKKNLRVTAARQRIFDILSSSKMALSPKEVFQQIVDAGLTHTDQVSVYRNLSLFTEMGLTHRFQDGKYSLCKQNHDHQHSHIHIIANCEFCGKTFEIPEHSKKMCQIAKEVQSFVESFRDFSSLTLQGSCHDCAPNKESPLARA